MTLGDLSAYWADALVVWFKGRAPPSAALSWSGQDLAQALVPVPCLTSRVEFLAKVFKGPLVEQSRILREYHYGMIRLFLGGNWLSVGYLDVYNVVCVLDL